MIQDVIMVLLVVLIMGGCILFVKKTNPDNRRRTTYYSTKDVFHKEICPHCRVKMKKTWKKESVNPMNMNTIIQREFKATPIYTCLKCGYKID